VNFLTSCGHKESVTGQGPPVSNTAGTAGTAVETAYRQHLPAIVRYLRRRLGDGVSGPHRQ